MGTLKLVTGGTDKGSFDCQYVQQHFTKTHLTSQYLLHGFVECLTLIGHSWHSKVCYFCIKDHCYE